MMKSFEVYKALSSNLCALALVQTERFKGDLKADYI
jgi:hypothetical protein